MGVSREYSQKKAQQDGKFTLRVAAQYSDFIGRGGILATSQPYSVGWDCMKLSRLGCLVVQSQAHTHMKIDKASLISQHFLIINSVQRYTQFLHILHHTSLTYLSFAIILRSCRHLTNEVRMETAQMKVAVNGVESIIGYVFDDRFLLWEALQAAGSPVVHAGGRSFRNGNKRLAVLGDTVLQLALVEQWYAGEQARGTITTVTSSLLSY